MTVRDSQEKHAITILVEIKGASDNLRWKTIKTSLPERRCPTNFLALCSSYLRYRVAQIVGRIGRAYKTVTKGCPQGSVLGPDFWNLTFDVLLKRLEQLGGCIIVKWAGA